MKENNQKVHARKSLKSLSKLTLCIIRERDNNLTEMFSMCRLGPIRTYIDHDPLQFNSNESENESENYINGVD